MSVRGGILAAHKQIDEVRGGQRNVDVSKGSLEEDIQQALFVGRDRFEDETSSFGKDLFAIAGAADLLVEPVRSELLELANAVLVRNDVDHDVEERGIDSILGLDGEGRLVEVSRSAANISGSSSLNSSSFFVGLPDKSVSRVGFARIAFLTISSNE